MARKAVQHLCAGVVGPLDVVYHENRRTTAARGFDELIHCTRQPRLPRFGEIVRQLRQTRTALADFGNQRGKLGKRHRRQRAQRCGRYAVERTRDKLDHRLVRHRAFDLVAFCRQRRQVLGVCVALDFAQQAALANARFAFDQNSVPDAGRQPCDESDEQAVFVSPADERGGIARHAAGRIGGEINRGGRRAGFDRCGIQPQTVRGLQRTRHSEEIASLRLGNAQRCSEPFGQPARGAALVGFDFSDREARAENPLGERLLGEIQRFAPSPQPVAERICPILHAVCPPFLICV